MTCRCCKIADGCDACREQERLVEELRARIKELESCLRYEQWRDDTMPKIYKNECN